MAYRSSSLHGSARREYGRHGARDCRDLPVRREYREAVMAEVRRTGVVVAGGSLERLMGQTFLAELVNHPAGHSPPGRHVRSQALRTGRKVSLIQIPAVRQREAGRVALWCVRTSDGWGPI
jgi:hypothetical protein